MHLLLHGRTAEALVTLQNELGVPALFCVADLATYDGAQKALAFCALERPNVVINCAGFGLYGDFVEHPVQQLQEMIALNNAFVVALCREMAALWSKEGTPGTILNVSSVLGITSAPGAALYGATKAFINSFSEALDVELSPRGIRVLTACPGRVATNFAARASNGKTATHTAQGMILDPKEVAEAIFLQITSSTPFKVINWKYRLLLLAQKLVPRRTALKTLYGSLKSRT